MREEKDPTGKPQHDPGAKLDHGKPKCAQILSQFSNALMEVSKIGTFGADKYSMGGWREVEDGQNRYADARLRHFLKRSSGELVDQDSGLLHLSHEAWNVLAELELYLKTLPQKE